MKEGNCLMSNQKLTQSKIGKAVIKSATPIKIKGATIDLMSSKINNFTGCY